MTVLPFVAEPPGDPGLVEEVAQAAARAWGLAAPELLRAGMNVLFSCGEEVVLRVGRTTAPPEQGVWLLGLLTGAGLRVP